MSFKQIRNYPRDLAQPYVVVPNRDAFNIVPYTNADGTYGLTSDSVHCEFDDAGWSGGFPSSEVTFDLPNYKCKKFVATITSAYGNASITVNGVTKENGVGTYVFDIPKRAKSITVKVRVNNYATPTTTSGVDGYITVKDIHFIRF